MRRFLWPALLCGLAACAQERPSSGFVWCEFYTERVYFSPVIPSVKPFNGTLCDGFQRTVTEQWNETEGGVLPEILAYPTEAEARDRRQREILAKERNGLEVVTVEWQP